MAHQGFSKLNLRFYGEWTTKSYSKQSKMASTGALLGGSRLFLSSNSQNRKPFATFGLRRSSANRNGSNKRASVYVQAIAAPEKTTNDEPFTAWGTAIERVAKRTDLKTIMILGAGPIVIGQVSGSLNYRAIGQRMRTNFQLGLSLGPDYFCWSRALIPGLIAP